MPQSNYSKEQIQNIKATPQEMDAWEALRREPGLMGRLARRGKHMKRDYVGGRRAFSPAGSYAKDDKGASPGTASDGGTTADRGNFETRTDVIQGRSTAAGRSGDYTGQQNQQQGGFAEKFGAKTPEQIEADRKAAAKKKWDADRKSATEKYEKGKTGRERSKFTEGTMKDAEGRTMEDRGVMTDAEGNVEGDEGFNFETAEMKGGYDASTGKMDTEGSFAGYQEDYKGLRDKADYSGTREGVLTDKSGKREGEAGYDAKSATMQGGLRQYQRQADELAGEAKGKYAGYESDIAGQPDYASKVATMGESMASTGTKAQQDLAKLSTQIDTSTTEGKQALTDAAGKMGIAAGEIA